MMKHHNLYLLTLLAAGQLPLGLLRKKYRPRKNRRMLHVVICIASLMTEVITGASSPLMGLIGLILHVGGSRLCVVGVTGGMGSGKTTLTDFLQANQFTIIDADKVAREIVEPGKPAYNELLRCFGTAILNADSPHLNRTHLRNLIFSSESARKRVNQITHIHIFRSMLWQLVYTRLVLLQPRVVVVAPLLFESAVLGWVCSPVVVVDVSSEKQRERLEVRDGNVSPSVLIKAAASQMPLEEKRDRADIVFDNNGPREDLFEQARNHFREAYGWVLR